VFFFSGTIFNGKKLMTKQKNIVTLFSTVFSRRIIQNAKVQKCQVCSCSPGDDGIGKVECYLCEYPRYTSSPEDVDDLEIDTEEEEDLFVRETTTMPTISRTNIQKPFEDTETDNEDAEDGDDDDDDEDDEEEDDYE